MTNIEPQFNTAAWYEERYKELSRDVKDAVMWYAWKNATEIDQRRWRNIIQWESAETPINMSLVELMMRIWVRGHNSVRFISDVEKPKEINIVKLIT